MFGFALRRLLWLVPALLTISVITFAGLSRLPDRDATAERVPLFVNTQPAGLQQGVLGWIDVIAKAPPSSAASLAARRKLERSGGAALPSVLGNLDRYPSAERTRIALALANIGDRMEVSHRGEPYDPAKAVLFWNRFWESNRGEFRQSSARSAVSRYARYGTQARAADVRRLDTFALPVLIEALTVPKDFADVSETRRVIELLVAIAQRGKPLAADAGVADARRAAVGWREWWRVSKGDYISLSHTSQAAATLVETQYGQWLYAYVGRPLTRGSLRGSRWREFFLRLEITASIFFLGMAVAYLLTIPLGTVTALARGAATDRVIAVTATAAYLLTPVMIGIAYIFLVGIPERGIVAAGILLGLTVAADPLHHYRAAVVGELPKQYVEAARARGGTRFRTAIRHILPNVVGPMAARAALDLPLSLTACFVLEYLFGLPGIGFATVSAVRDGDVAWLMMVGLMGALAAAVAMVASDLFMAAIDPRIRDGLLRRQGRL